MSDTEISRHFVTVQGNWGPRQVHYRRAGTGPTLLLLHQSPQSSREFEPLMQVWGENFTVIAADAPGYGLSDPLGVAQAEPGGFCVSDHGICRRARTARASASTAITPAAAWPSRWRTSSRIESPRRPATVWSC